MQALHVDKPTILIIPDQFIKQKTAWFGCLVKSTPLQNNPYHMRMIHFFQGVQIKSSDKNAKNIFFYSLMLFEGRWLKHMHGVISLKLLVQRLFVLYRIKIFTINILYI